MLLHLYVVLSERALICHTHMHTHTHTHTHTHHMQFASGASMRVKKVMASISFVGVSIISSAITTMVAIIPLMGTWIQLFTRFGAILLIETFVAIVYTLVFCSTFLGLFGPLKAKLKYRLVNAVCTIFGTIGFYLVGLIALAIAARAGVNIPGPDGRPLFG